MMGAGWVLVLAAGLAPVGVEDAPGEPPEAATQSSAIDTLLAEGMAGFLRPVSLGHVINGSDVEHLKRQGLADPLSQVVDSLVAHPEIIPHGTLARGRVGFYWREGIHILDRSWVYAVFSDGHFEGRGLFEYAIRPDSSIAFTVLYSDLGPN